MVIFGDRRLAEWHALGHAGRVAMGSFQVVPSPVLATNAGFGEVDLFPVILADVGDVHVAGLAVEGELPRVAQPV